MRVRHQPIIMTIAVTPDLIELNYALTRIYMTVLIVTYIKRNF